MTTIIHIVKSFIAVCIIATCFIVVFFTIKKPRLESIPVNDSTATLPVIVSGKNVGTIDAVKIYELVTADGSKIYVTISNDPGVTAALTVVK